MNQITVNKSLIIRNNKDSFRLDEFTVEAQGDVVYVRAGRKPMWSLNFNDTTVSGTSYTDTTALMLAISALSKSGESGGGSIPLGDDNQLLGYEAGVAKPVIIQIKHLSDINGFPSFSNGVFTATAINSTAKTALLSFIEFSTTTPKVGTFPTYGTAGVLPIGNATADNHAAAFGQIPKVATVAPLANGPAAVGTSALYARQDHVHPLQASIATLTTGRTIGLTGGATGTSVAFNGSANVTITVTLATPTATVRGGVLQQPAIPDIDGRPIDESDYNTLLAALRTAGLLAT